MIYHMAENNKLWYTIHERNNMPITIRNCITCGNKFETNRAHHKNRNPIFCSQPCIRSRSVKGNPGFRWRRGKGFWQIASDEQKHQKLRELYEKNVIKNPEGCWGWKNKLMPNGYAKLGMGKGKIISAHRFSWIMHNGPIKDNLFVLHKCDQKYCSKIEHLFLGTTDDNMQDMVSKGRQMHGENHYSHKLTSDQVLEIRKLRLEGFIMKNLAIKFGVSLHTISDIVNRRIWRHI